MIRRPPRSTLFPTRRSSDLITITSASARLAQPIRFATEQTTMAQARPRCSAWPKRSQDRKSTRLNSSHVEISYAVFCLKKKKKKQKNKNRTKKHRKKILQT